MTKTIDDLIVKIRQEERQKVLAEIQEQAEKEEVPRKQVMEHIKSRMVGLGMRPNYQHYQILNAFSVIVRYVLSVNRLDKLNHDQVEIAINVADELIDITSVNRRQA